MPAVSPNIVFMMCDDLGYGDVGFNGNTTIKTPCLDALRTEGAAFTRFYAGGPVCSPTRGTCLTGRHYWRYGINHANVGHLPAEEITLARIAKDNGYTTGHFGKWHLGTLDPTYSGKPRRDPKKHFAPPWERDYDVSLATEYAVPTWDPGRDRNNRTFERSDEPWQSPYYLNGEKIDEMLLGCDSKLVVDHAEPFIRDAVACQQPFMTTIWFHAPHEPVEAGPEFFAMYPDCHPNQAHYYGVVTAMDRQVGRVNDLVKELSIEDNTIIFFCSDNGPEGRGDGNLGQRNHGSTAGLRGRKRSLFNGGVGVPALAKWPGHIAAGSEFTMPCSTLDYFPTVCEILSSELPDDRPIDGINLLPLFAGEMSERGRPIPYHFLSPKNAMFDSPTLALMDDRFKLLTNLSEDGQENLLFDISNDPFETDDIIAQHPEQAKAMLADLNAFVESCRQSHAGADYPSAYEPCDDFQELTGGWR